MFGKSEAFDLFIDDWLSEKAKKLSETNGAYAALKEKLSRAVDSMQDNFMSDQLDRIDEFFCLTAEKAAITQKHLYFEGFRDCIRLLKLLEAY